jgi:hypothetical protein
VTSLGVGLADAKANDVAAVQFSMGQVEIAASIEGIEQRLVERVPGAVAEAH